MKGRKITTEKGGPWHTRAGTGSIKRGKKLMFSLPRKGTGRNRVGTRPEEKQGEVFFSKREGKVPIF